LAHTKEEEPMVSVGLCRAYKEIETILINILTYELADVY